MAEMIPDRAHSGASKGERRLFDALQKLPDDCIVYHEASVKNRYADFIVILPDLGLLVIEVKGWYSGEILKADSNHVTIRKRGQEQETVELHPVRQARNYMFKLLDVCRTHGSSSLLMQDEGPHRGKFVFPFGHCAILSNATREQLRKHNAGNLNEVFRPSQTITRDEFEEWSTLEGACLKAKLAELFDPTWSFLPLTGRQVDILRSVIHPEIGFTARDGDLNVLDLRQERNALSIGSGHRILYGVAGSGKTVLLIARAKFLAQDESKRILFLCYNKLLVSYIAHQLSMFSNVRVVNFHKWGVQMGVHFINGETLEAYGARVLDLIEQGDGDAGMYHATLIDEAQDFPQSWFVCAKLALEDPDNGDLLIAGDGSQSLRKGRKFTWRDCGVNAQGRTINKLFDLDKNYRNTDEILQAAYSFARPATMDADNDAMRSFSVNPTQACRSGPKPIILRAENREGELAAAVSLIEEWLRDGVTRFDQRIKLSPSDICILYPRVYDKVKALDQLCKGLMHLGPVICLTDKNAKNRLNDKSIKVCTIMSSKGLQFRAVILIWADLLPSKFSNRNENEERAQVYVALTRAEDFLAIIHSESSIYIDEIAKNLGENIVSHTQTLLLPPPKG